MRRYVTLFLVGCCTVGRADTMVKTHTVTTDSATSRSVQNLSEHHDVLYRSGTMRRKDRLGGAATLLVSDIANCATGIGFLIDSDAHEYRTYKVVKFGTMAQLDDYRKKNPQDVVQIESKTVDTGERRTFFGHLAKHFVTTTKRLADEKSAGGEETTDGWYIDHEKADNRCAPDYVRTEPFYVIGTGLVMLPQIAHFNHSGPVPSGLAVKLTVTHKVTGSRGAADRTIKIEETVEELSDSPLSPSLFELPAGFHENPLMLIGKPRTHP